MSNSISEIHLKQCRSCRSEFPATPEYFHRSKQYSDGLWVDCKSCYRMIRRKEFVLFSKIINGKKYCAFCERYLDISCFYPIRKGKAGLQNKCIECSGKYNAKYRKDLRNAEISKERSRAYRKANPEKVHRVNKEYQRNNPDKVRAWTKKWAKKYPKRARSIGKVEELKRRARKAALPDTFTKQQYDGMMQYWNNKCAISGETEDLSIDHWIPISDPVCPGSVATNLIPLTKSLNSSKRNSNPVEWLTWKFGEDEARLIIDRIEAYFEWARNQSG